MKKISILVAAIISALLLSCSGSDTYNGKWKATNTKGEKVDIAFQKKNFTIKKLNGDSTNYAYTQNSVSIENSVETYGITLKDGRRFQVKFPIANDESLGLINDENGNPIYFISRKKYIGYEDIFSLGH